MEQGDQQQSVHSVPGQLLDAIAGGLVAEQEMVGDVGELAHGAAGHRVPGKTGKRVGIGVLQDNGDIVIGPLVEKSVPVDRHGHQKKKDEQDALVRQRRCRHCGTSPVPWAGRCQGAPNSLMQRIVTAAVSPASDLKRGVSRPFKRPAP